MNEVPTGTAARGLLARSARARTTAGAAGALAAWLALAACGGGSVSVKPSPSGIKAAAKPKDCTVEFFRNPPAREHDELAELYGTYGHEAEPEIVLREKACELGADGVVVTRDQVISHPPGPDKKLIAGVAIKYRGTSGGAPGGGV